MDFSIGLRPGLQDALSKWVCALFKTRSSLMDRNRFVRCLCRVQLGYRCDELAGVV